jgi:hypothetical protein
VGKHNKLGLSCANDQFGQQVEFLLLLLIVLRVTISKLEALFGKQFISSVCVYQCVFTSLCVPVCVLVSVVCSTDLTSLFCLILCSLMLAVTTANISEHNIKQSKLVRSVEQTNFVCTSLFVPVCVY